MQGVLLLLQVVCFLVYDAGGQSCRFGETCRYNCNCAGRCGPQTGCAGNCLPSWDGPRCQRHNVALNQQTNQSSGLSSAPRYKSRIAVDDVLGHDVERTTCTHTKFDSGNWWKVFLDSSYNIYRFQIYNRIGYCSDIPGFACGARINGFTLSVGINDQGYSTCYTDTTSSNYGPGDIINGTCKDGYPRTGNTVRISLPPSSSRALTLCEVRLFVCSEGWYGEHCEKECVTASACSRCDPEGLRCQECVNGRWGENCLQDCGHCWNNTSCDMNTGKCPTGSPRCDAGYFGNECTTKCSPGRYGADCVQSCGHCADGTSSCSSALGHCPVEPGQARCMAGYIGKDCKTPCSPGKWGESCSKECGKNCQDKLCNGQTGSCEKGCRGRYGGMLCDRYVGINLGRGHLAGITVGAIILFCFATLGLIICGRRMKQTLLNSSEERIVIPPSLPESNRIESFTDLPDYCSMRHSPAVLYSSGVSQLLRGINTGACTYPGSVSSTGDRSQVFTLPTTMNYDMPNGNCSGKKKHKNGNNLHLQDCTGLASEEGIVLETGDPLRNGYELTLPVDNLGSIPNSVASGLGSVSCPDHRVLSSDLTGQNTMQHVGLKAEGNRRAASSLNGQTGVSDEILPYMRTSDILNNCLGLAISQADRGGVRRHTKPLELCYSTDKSLCNYGVQEAPITGPLRASTPFASVLRPRGRQAECEDWEALQEEPYMMGPEVVIEPQSLPPMLECGASHRRNSLGDSKADSTMFSMGAKRPSEGSPDEGISQAEQTCAPALVAAGSKGYISHPCSAVNDCMSFAQWPSLISGNLTISNGYLRRPDMTSDETSSCGDSPTSVESSSAMVGLNQVNSLSVIRPMTKGPADKYFLDAHALDDLPATDV